MARAMRRLRRRSHVTLDFHKQLSKETFQCARGLIIVGCVKSTPGVAGIVRVTETFIMIIVIGS